MPMHAWRPPSLIRTRRPQSCDVRRGAAGRADAVSRVELAGHQPELFARGTRGPRRNLHVGRGRL